jgi:predicted dienelactone hydrolase
MLTDDPDDHREFMVRVWYPAEPEPGAKPTAYWPDADIIGPIRVRDDFHKWGLTFLPSFFFNHFDLMRSNSFPDAPISAAEPTYPVVLFSPGGGVIHERNFLHHEELASHGYIVFSLSAPYDSWAVMFPDGRIVRGAHLKAGTEPTEEEKERTEIAQKLVERLQSTTDIPERKEIMREFFALDPDGIMDKLLFARVADARFLRDELERLSSGQRESPFEGRLDLHRVGIFGMSLGGAVTGQVCLEDQRFKAGINLDGTQFGTVIDGYITQPFMFMNSGDSKDHNDFVYDRLQHMGYSVTVAGSSHMDFTDMFYTSPFVKMLGRNAIRDDRMAHVANSYIVAFFDSYLKGQTSPLLDGPSDEFPDVTFKVISQTDIELAYDPEREEPS